MSDFGTAVKNLRHEHKITQRALAQKIGVDFSYISKIENGKLENSPSIDIITKIAQVFKTDPDELILLAKKVPHALKEIIVVDDLAATFLRKVPTMTLEQRKRIRDYIDEV
jgi:transcriptional regulator with XRE-family HTH domain